MVVEMSDWQPRAERIKAPTLADLVVRETYRPETVLWGSREVRDSITRARKFVLDEGMSAFMADLAYASLPEHVYDIVTPTSRDIARVHALLDGMRAMARLPHALTWIEYDAVAKARRARDEYGASLEVSTRDLPDRAGWLITQHPGVETAYRAIEFASHSWNETHRTNTPQPWLYAMTWRTDDGPPPWPYFDIFERCYEINKGLGGTAQHIAPAGWMTGIVSYASESVSVAQAFNNQDFVERYVKHAHYHIVQEGASDLRYLWSLLATIDRLPVVKGEVKASKGYVARGTYRRFMDHTTITLHVPTTRYRTVARRSLALVRRKRHHVRGHWRLDVHHPVATLCDHAYRGTQDGHVECVVCGGRRLWVREHERGDASLGFTLHDYNVSRG